MKPSFRPRSHVWMSEKAELLSFFFKINGLAKSSAVTYGLGGHLYGILLCNKHIVKMNNVP